MNRPNDMKAFTLRPEDAATVIYGAGDEYRYLATGKETNGTYFALEATAPPGAGPPPHIQSNEEEAFYVIAGMVTFWPDGEEVVAGPGTFVHVPRERGRLGVSERHTCRVRGQSLTAQRRITKVRPEEAALLGQAGRPGLVSGRPGGASST